MSKVIACIETDNQSARAVCDYAAWASNTLQAPLCFLHVLEKAEQPVSMDLSGNIGPDEQQHLLEELVSIEEQRARLMREQGRMLLEQACKRALDEHASKAHSLQRMGSLLESLDELNADTRLLVIGRKGSRPDSQIGANVERVIRSQHKPILISIGEYRPPSHTLIAYDGSETGRKLIDMIAASPLLKGFECTVLMVGSDRDNLRKQVDQAAATLEATGHQVNTRIESGEVESTITRVLAETSANLLVMGAYGHSRIRQWLVGSTTTRLLQTSTVPVLLLR